MTSGINVNLSGNLSSDDWECIELFKKRADKLSNTEFSSGRHPINGTIEYNQAEGIVFDCDIPPDHITVEHLTAYRHFCAKKEKCYFPRVLKIIARYADDDARAALKSFRIRWENGLFNDAMMLYLNGEKMTAAMLLDVWFNGEFFHSVDEKVEKLEAMEGAFPNDFFKYMLLDAVTNGSKQVLMIGEGLKGLNRNTQPLKFFAVSVGVELGRLTSNLPKFSIFIAATKYGVKRKEYSSIKS